MALPSSLPILQHLAQLLIGDAGVLHGVGNVLVSKLPLHGRDIASLLYKVFAHPVPGRVQGAVFDPGEVTDLVPDGINHPGFEPAAAMDRGGCY